jgi:hypothetical protein
MGVGVLGFQVGEHPGILAVPQPGVFVDPGLAVDRGYGRRDRRDGRLGLVRWSDVLDWGIGDGGGAGGVRRHSGSFDTKIAGITTPGSDKSSEA